MLDELVDVLFLINSNIVVMWFGIALHDMSKYLHSYMLGNTWACTGNSFLSGDPNSPTVISEEWENE